MLEIGDELCEYCGKVLAGVGAEVIKVEPPRGEITRTYGPFHEDEPGPESSLYFWHYNVGKLGITLDLDAHADQAVLRRLAQTADVVLESRPYGYLDERGIGSEALRSIHSGLIVARISAFGDDGPWSAYKGSDLVHLALGGVMMNCGYDPDPSGEYDTPPIAPQMWQSYQIAGELTAMAILGALYHRESTGEGQHLSTPVHQAVAQQTETDLPNWVYARQPHSRRTCRHSRPQTDAPVLAASKDGRWLLPYRSYLGEDGGTELQRTVEVLDRYGMADDLADPKYRDPEYQSQLAVRMHIGDVVGRLVNRVLFDRDLWREFQDAGLTWAPVRRPEENVPDSHWQARETFLEADRPELGRTFTEVGAKWLCAEAPWRRGPRSPRLGEHNDAIIGALDREPPRARATRARHTRRRAGPTKRPAALAGVRFVDLGWILASAGAGRFLAALGAEVIKVEHRSRWDTMRFKNGIVPPGGREQRERATAPIDVPTPTSPNRGGFFMEINAGKRSISLNLKHPRGKELLGRLLAGADVLAEGFSPGAMERMGFGYERLKEINPRLVYVQQSGMGQHGSYGRLRSYGPVAQAFSGLSEMSGLPEPYPPAGIGYSYLDWFGAYNMAFAILAGLYRQKRTGRGCWIDSSQVEAGIFLTGTAVLDHSVNGRHWSRFGNRSPYKAGAPHGAFRTRGADRWIALACFDDEEWHGLVRVLDHLDWADDPRFSTLAARLAHEGELETLVGKATETWEPYELMEVLQRAGVPAGVCQTAQDRYEADPQLRHLAWMVELEQSEIGTWPVKEFPVRFSSTPPYMGGVVNRHGPSYGEDNEYVYGELLGLSSREIRGLEEDGVI